MSQDLFNPDTAPVSELYEMEHPRRMSSSRFKTTQVTTSVKIDPRIAYACILYTSCKCFNEDL